MEPLGIVHIEVLGGVAHVVRKDSGIELVLEDHDNKKLDGTPEIGVWDADTVVTDES